MDIKIGDEIYALSFTGANVKAAEKELGKIHGLPYVGIMYIVSHIETWGRTAFDTVLWAGLLGDHPRMKIEEAEALWDRWQESRQPSPGHSKFGQCFDDLILALRDAGYVSPIFPTNAETPAGGA
jgi:hypothetical protein